MLCKGSFPPEHPIFALAAQMRMRYQAVDRQRRDDARKAVEKQRHSFVFKYINISDVNIK
jgi:hypothetical protein